MKRMSVTVSLLIAAAVANAQTYPAKPVHLIVPFPAGGANDVVMRPFAALFGPSLKTEVLLDYRPGGGTLIGAGLAAKALPDGYTLLVCGPGTQVAGPMLNRASATYDPLRDFAPVSLLAQAPMMLTTYNNFPKATLVEFVAAAKANPGKLTYASGGAGSPSHLAAAIFASMAGIKLLHVPYKGGGDAMADMLAGRVDVKFDSTPSSMPPVKAGRLKAIAIASDPRWPDLPKVQTFKEAGWPNYKVSTWYGLCAPARTSDAIISQLNRAARQALGSKDYQEQLRKLGASPVGSTPQEFAKFIREENEIYRKVIKGLGLIK